MLKGRAKETLRALWVLANPWASQKSMTFKVPNFAQIRPMASLACWRLHFSMILISIEGKGIFLFHILDTNWCSCKGFCLPGNCLEGLDSSCFAVCKICENACWGGCVITTSRKEKCLKERKPYLTAIWDETYQRTWGGLIIGLCPIINGPFSHILDRLKISKYKTVSKF